MSNHTVTRKRNRRSVLYLVTLRSFASAVSCKFCARDSVSVAPPKHRAVASLPRRAVAVHSPIAHEFLLPTATRGARFGSAAAREPALGFVIS